MDLPSRAAGGSLQDMGLGVRVHSSTALGGIKIPTKKDELNKLQSYRTQHLDIDTVLKDEVGNTDRCIKRCSEMLISRQSEHTGNTLQAF